MEVLEDVGVIQVCVDVCEGVLKRDVQISVEELSGTAECEYKIVMHILVLLVTNSIIAHSLIDEIVTIWV